MRTLVKALLFVCWLLGAGSGISLQGTEPVRDTATYYTVTDGVGLSMDDRRVTLHLGSQTMRGGGVALSTVLPHWAAARPDRSDPTLKTASASVVADDESKCFFPSFTRVEP